MDAMSGLTSQPNLGSIVAALRHGPRDPGLDQDAIRTISAYWEDVRRFYRPFESEMRAGSSDVYEHEMPGGQYTNLREQAQAMGLGERWQEITQTYATVNRLFGDVIKVTPTSKVVGDMTLVMTTSGLTPEDVLDPAQEIAFPQSVVEFFHGDLGQPPGGFPAALQRKVLKGRAPLTVRPGQTLASADLAAARADAQRRVGHALSDAELASYLMYPEVFVAFAAHRGTYGDVHVLPTPVFFYGMQVGQEIAVEIERGKTLIIRYSAMSDPDADGRRTLFFELNGQPRSLKVVDRRVAPARAPARKAEDGNPLHVAAPMPGLIVRVAAAEDQPVREGDPLVTLEAMKMQTVIYAGREGVVRSIVTPVGTRVTAGDLLMELKA
jgi:pyruvate carboxylase